MRTYKYSQPNSVYILTYYKLQNRTAFTIFAAYDAIASSEQVMIYGVPFATDTQKSQKH